MKNKQSQIFRSIFSTETRGLFIAQLFWGCYIFCGDYQKTSQPITVLGGLLSVLATLVAIAIYIYYSTEIDFIKEKLEKVLSFLYKEYNFIQLFKNGGILL
ncbi:hypothetical protein [Selenomonas ruminantium]|uniref:hypothetical protein n=1 Tax=Selenomonas ruminantium TaxID=971 RepID=UPI0005A52988|nr:hypothetical protein [Selenomonas ruminantium]